MPQVYRMVQQLPVESQARSTVPYGNLLSARAALSGQGVRPNNGEIGMMLRISQLQVPRTPDGVTSRLEPARPEASRLLLERRLRVVYRAQSHLYRIYQRLRAVHPEIVLRVAANR